MATIQNNTTHIFSPASQQEIRNAMANCGLDEVVTRTNKDDEVDNVFNFFDTEGNYQFSIDIEGDVIFENQYIA
jgi:phenylalanyl-tRNA synthetase beta subunit